MNKKSWMLVATIATIVTTAAAQTTSVTLSGGPPGNFQRWGSSLTLLATVTGGCSASPTSANVSTSVLRGPGSVPVTPLTFNAGLPCNGGTFTWPFAFSPAWIEIDSDWQALRSTASSPAGTGNSNVLSLRFDPEFVLSGGITATLATGAAGFSNCDGHVFELVDREAMGAPPPPPNFRTPFEMFRVTTSRCDNGFPQLLNMRLPSGFGGTLVYDRISGTAQWRDTDPPAFPCGTGPLPPCPLPVATPPYRKFDYGANIGLFGDAAGVHALVAFWSRQPDVRGYDLQDMWWAGPSESGWGLNIAKSGDNLFVAGYIYDAEGKPMWVYMPSGRWDTNTMVWYGDLYSPQGSRYGAYDPLLFRAGTAIGTGSISFTDSENGHFDYTINGLSGGKAIGRYRFAPPQQQPGKYTGIWWGGFDQAGWGLSVSHQANTVFATWYTYGDDQKATWFFMPAGQQTAPGVFSGDLFRATGAPWAGRHYSADSTKITRVGTMELRFGNDRPGTMTAVVNGETIVMPLSRFDF